MKTDDLESKLRNLLFTHLTEDELVAFCDQKLDQISRVQAEAHLKRCFICEQRIADILEEMQAPGQGQVSAEDVVLVERLIEQVGLTPPTPTPTREVPLQDRLTEYLRLMVASLQIAFKPVRGTEWGEVIWSWQSEDGRFKAHATMEKNAEMIVHIATTEMELEGARLHFRVGTLNLESTLKRASDLEVAAQVNVPWQYRQTADISIEIV